MDEAYDSIVDVGILEPSGLSQRVPGFQNLSKVVKDVEVTVYIVKFHFYFSSKFPLHLDDNFCDSNPNRSDTKSRSWYDALLFGKTALQIPQIPKFQAPEQGLCESQWLRGL